MFSPLQKQFLFFIYQLVSEEAAKRAKAQHLYCLYFPRKSVLYYYHFILFLDFIPSTTQTQGKLFIMSKRARDQESYDISASDLVNRLKKRVVTPTKTLRLVNRQSQQPFQFAQPQPIFNVNTGPINTPMDVEQGEMAARQPFRGYAVAPPPPLPSYSSRAYQRVKRVAANSKAAALSYSKAVLKRKSKASLARARVSSKKGGSAPPKKTLIKAANKGTYLVHFRAIMKFTRAKINKALALEPKAVVAACLAKRYTK